MKDGAKNRSNTRKILNNNNVHMHACTHACTPLTPHTQSNTHTHTHTHTHTIFFWLTNNLKHSITYSKKSSLNSKTVEHEIEAKHTEASKEGQF